MPQTVKPPDWLSLARRVFGVSSEPPPPGLMQGNAPAGAPEPWDDRAAQNLTAAAKAMLDPTGPILEGKTPDELSGWQKAGMAAGAALLVPGLLGKVVYHGTPHTFSPCP